ncbi:MAG TPA: hydroxyacid dehydrogenase [Thermoplasmata archaeon]|nr:hydroxyacid dehydrogenase [Thermoplasmata archaeon]
MKILVTDGLEAEALATLRRHHEVDAIEADPKQLLDLIGGYEAVIVRSRTKVTADVLAKGSRLKVVGRAGIGVDNIDVKAATARRVPVVNAPTGSTISVAELAIGHMLSLARHLAEADRTMKEGKWEKKRFEGRELHAKVLGLVGSGRIGAEVARRAQAFGMEVIAFDPYLPPAAARERGIRLVDTLPALLMQADFLSIHAALTPETKGMIGATEIALMKRTAYLVNCARGEIVQEAALADALTSGTIAGAALDVFEREPPTGSPILTAPNTVFTPHLGASTHEAQARAGGIIADQVLKVLRGERPDFAVNPEVYPV